MVCVQVLFACAEALHAHGYSNEACRLAVELARDLLANPPDLKVEQPQTKVEQRGVFFCFCFTVSSFQTPVSTFYITFVADPIWKQAAEMN